MQEQRIGREWKLKGGGQWPWHDGGGASGFNLGESKMNSF
jgi:hypothetical protein